MSDNDTDDTEIDEKQPEKRRRNIQNNTPPGFLVRD